MTEPQLSCLEFIRERIRRDGLAPTYPQIAEHLGIKSRSSISAMVQRLVRDGHLLKTRSGHRNLRLPGADLAVVPTEDLRAELERRA
jgi:SOS-response transcriptional repressor LexA